MNSKIYQKPVHPIKQKHSLAGHSYNRVCGRNCYLINRLHRWTYCECMEKLKKKNSKNITVIKFIP